VQRNLNLRYVSRLRFVLLALAWTAVILRLYNHKPLSCCHLHDDFHVCARELLILAAFVLIRTVTADVKSFQTLVLSGTNICRFLLFRASMVRIPAHSYSGTRKYLGALRRVNPERTSSPQLIVIRCHHLEISPHTFKPALSDAISHPWKLILEAFDEGPESFRIRVTFFDEARHVVGPTLWLFRGRWSFT